VREKKREKREEKRHQNTLCLIAFVGKIKIVFIRKRLQDKGELFFFVKLINDCFLRQNNGTL
jgi:hypothetical protein